MYTDPSHDVKMVSAGENSSDTEASEMEDDSVGGIVQVLSLFVELCTFLSQDVCSSCVVETLDGSS